MDYVIGAAAGLVFGGLIGQLKNLFIWRAYLRKSSDSGRTGAGGWTDSDGRTDGSGVPAAGAAGYGQESLGGLYARSLISYAVNIAALFAAFLIRDMVPFNGIALLIGTAVALTIMNKVLTVQQKKWERDAAAASEKRRP